MGDILDFMARLVRFTGRERNKFLLPSQSGRRGRPVVVPRIQVVAMRTRRRD